MAEIQQIRENAIKLERDGKFLQASLMYEEMLELDPSLARARVSQAVCFFKAKKFDMAIEALNAAIRTEPQLFIAHYNKGIVLKQLRRYDEALDSFERALQLRPEVFVYGEAAEMAIRAQQYEKALDVTAKGLLDAKTFSHSLHVQRIAAFFGLVQHEDALDDVQAIIRETGWAGLKPVELRTCATVYRHTATRLLDQGHTEEALALLKELNKALRQSDASALCAQAFCLVLLERVDKALEILQVAREVDPTNWRTDVAEAKARMQLGEFEHAARLLKSVLEVDECSGNTALRFLYAESLFRLERYAEAHENFEFVHQYETSNWVASDRLGYLLLHFEKWTEAVEVLRHAIASSDGEATDSTYYNLGYGLLMQGEEDVSAAQVAFQNAFRLNPDNEHAKTALEQIRKLLPESEESLTTASSSRPRSSQKATEESTSVGKHTIREEQQPSSTETTRISTRISKSPQRVQWLTQVQAELAPSTPSSPFKVIPTGNTAKLLGRFNRGRTAQA